MEPKDFFDLIRRQTGRAVLPEADKSRPKGARPGPFDPRDLVDRMATEVEAVNGRFHAVATADAGWDLLLDLFESYEATDYLAWDDRHIPLPDLNGRLQAAGYRRGQTDLPREAEARNAAQHAAAAARIGITGAQGGLADTGSLIVQAGLGRSRLASLLPQVHVALLTIDQLFPTMAHFIQERPAALQESSNLVYITGPSRTADIEQTLTLGVHGPKHLHVILLP